MGSEMYVVRNVNGEVVVNAETERRRSTPLPDHLLHAPHHVEERRAQTGWIEHGSVPGATAN